MAELVDEDDQPEEDDPGDDGIEEQLQLLSLKGFRAG